MARIVVLRLGDITRFQNEGRINLSRWQCEQQAGEFPYYGQRGIIARINTFSYEGEYLLFTGAPPGSPPSTPALAVSGRFSANTRVHVLACVEDVEPRFLCRCLNSLPPTALPRSLWPNAVGDIEIALPPPEDQKQILASLLDIEKKKELLLDQNRVLNGMAQSLFDRFFIFGGGKDRPLGDFVRFQPASMAETGLPAETFNPNGSINPDGITFHKLLLYPREDLSPLFIRLLITNPEFLAHTEKCWEYREGRRQINTELLMKFALSSSSGARAASFPAGAYPEFNTFALLAEKKLAANNAELKLLADIEQSLFPPV
jgi:hypothetical protein